MPTLVITGMHRSHTSLLAQAMHSGGLYLGSDLIEASPSNPYGHFESKQIVELHQSWIKLHKLGSFTSVIDPDRALRTCQSKEFMDAAREVLGTHFDQEIFGFKDPRLPFFLEGWHEVLHDPYYTFTIRDPLQVVQSLMKRQSHLHSPMLRLDHIVRYLKLWRATYERIESFMSQCPDRCILIKTPEDLIKPTAQKAIRDRIVSWSTDLPYPIFGDIIDPKLIKEKPVSRNIKLIWSCLPSVKRLYSRLISQALGSSEI